MQVKRNAILSIFNIALLFSLISFSGPAYSYTSETYHTELVISKAEEKSKFQDYRYDSKSLCSDDLVNSLYAHCFTRLLSDVSKKNEHRITSQNLLFLNIKDYFLSINLLPVNHAKAVYSQYS